jgi:uncharacterized protein YdaU (DUF1376 family)
MKAPYFPFFVKDWLCSNRILNMSGDAVKAYMYLLSASWLEIPRATIPADDASIAKMCRVDADTFARIKDDVLQHYKQGKCKEHLGRLYQETLLEISRKSENNQRFNNKNAKRTRIKHKTNAPLEYENDNENASESASDSSRRGKGGRGNKFTPPTIEEVEAYCHERGDIVDPQRWYDHYLSNGWKVGKTHMVDWKASVRTWETTGYSKKTSTTQQEYRPPTEAELNEWAEKEAAKYGKRED